MIAYIPVSQFARMAHPFRSRHRYLAVFYAFFDESGDPRDTSSKVVALACLVASENDWKTWERKWQRILRRFRVSALHMKDFEHRYREFEGWSQDRADSFIAQLVGISKDAISYGISLSLRMDHWQIFIKPNMVVPYEEKRGPYIFLLQTVLWNIVEKATYLPKGEQIACFFEENNYVQAVAKSHYTLLKQEQGWEDILLGVSFEPKTGSYRSRQPTCWPTKAARVLSTA